MLCAAKCFLSVWWKRSIFPQVWELPRRFEAYPPPTTEPDPDVTCPRSRVGTQIRRAGSRRAARSPAIRSFDAPLANHLEAPAYQALFSHSVTGRQYDHEAASAAFSFFNPHGTSVLDSEVSYNGET